MTNILAIHGSFGNPYENWMPWLGAKCGEANLPFFAPVFPSPEGQTYENWASILKGYENAGVLTDKTILVAHSSGASFVLKYATRNLLKAKKFISVSGFTDFTAGDPDFDAINSQFYLKSEEKPDTTGIGSCVAFYSESDPFLPKEVLSKFVTTISARAIMVADGGHFNSTSGYDQFDALFNEILSD